MQMICQNIEKVLADIQHAAVKSQREPKEIKLIAVSKKMPPNAIARAQQCGQLIFGENYIQEARSKIEQLDPQLRWHFIGHLQSNKAKEAARIFQMVETVDRLKIARSLDRHAGNYGRSLEILIQVNIGEEPQKSGVPPEQTSQLLQNIQELKNLRIRGLMTTPPYGRQAEQSRSWFRSLKKISLQCAEKGLFYDNDRVELSMGMSGDYKVAIEEGATIIRVGTAIFGSRL